MESSNGSKSGGMESALALEAGQKKDEAMAEEERLCRQAAVEEPYSFRTHCELGDYYFRLGRYTESLNAYLTALSLDDFMGEEEEIASSVYRRIGEMYNSLKEPAKAKRYLDRFVGFFPFSTHAREVSLELSSQKGISTSWFATYAGGHELYLKGKYWDACLRFQSVAQEYDDFPWSFFYWGLCLTHLGSPDEALRAMEKANSLDPHPMLYYQMGILYNMSGNLFMEENCYAKALDLNPNFADACYQMGILCYRRKERKRALSYLSRALDIRANSEYAEEALTAVADIINTLMPEDLEWDKFCHEELGFSFPYPLKWMALSCQPPLILNLCDDHTAPRYRLTYRIHLMRTTPQEFFSRIRKKCREDPSCRAMSEKVLKVAGSDGRIIQWEAKSTGEFVQEIYLVRNILILSISLSSRMEHQESSRMLMKYILEGASLAPEGICLKLEREFIEKNLTSSPGSLSWSNALARLLLASGDPSRAQVIIQQVLCSDPLNFEGNFSLGIFLIQQKRFDQAVRWLQNCLKKEPDSTEAIYQIGLAFEGRGKPHWAIREYAKAVDLDPGDARFRLALGRACYLIGKADVARKELEKALEIEPGNAEIMTEVGDVYAMMGRMDDAIGLLKRAVEIDDDNLGARVKLGFCFWKRGFLELAEKELQKVLYKHPGHKEAEKIREAIRRQTKKARRY